MITPIMDNNENENKVHITDESTVNTTEIRLRSTDMTWINKYKNCIKHGYNDEKAKLIKTMTRNIVMYMLMNHGNGNVNVNESWE